MSGLKIGELFAGYGGLGMGVQSVLGGDIAWFSEFDDAPSKILATQFPGVPNHGDITAIDWSTVEPVDILTGGFPCQDVSLAGARAGFTPTSRSGLWSEFARAIAALKPRLVVIENVRGLLSASAAGSVERDPWGVGDGATRPVVNALGAVLGDLAGLGYDAVWTGVRAADAGAPHGRYRVFIVAHPRRSEWGEGDTRERDLVGQSRIHAERQEGAGGYRPDREIVENPDVPTGRQWGQSAPGQTQGGRPRADAGRRGRASSADTDGDESERRGIGRDVGGTPPRGQSEGDQRERLRHAARDSRATAANPDSSGLAIGRTLRIPSSQVEESRATLIGDSASAAVAWGVYEPAIRRWESVTGRLAPAPTDQDWLAWGRRRSKVLRRRHESSMPIGMRGSLRAITTPPAHRLSAPFVEWMMGLPEGHVTHAGLTRNEQLKALGNGVVWQQAALAIRTLTPHLQA